MNRRLARRDRARALASETHRRRIVMPCALCEEARPVRKMVYAEGRTGLVAICDVCVEEDDE